MSAIFNENDLILLDKTLSIREKLIDSIVEKELPETPREINSFTNLLESVDRSILNKAKVKLEDTNTKINEESKEILRNLLLELHKNKNNSTEVTEDNTSSIPEFKSIGLDINEGELIVKEDPISLLDIEK